MTPHARIAAMIDALRPGPVLEAHADTLDILDALNDRIDALERSARADRLQARPFKGFAGLKPKRTHDADWDEDAIQSNATLNESRQPGRRK